MTSHESEVRRGTAYGAGAYLLWGMFPLYFVSLEPSGALEILLHRIVWTLVVCAALLAATRGWSSVVGLAASPRELALLGAAAVVIAVNWGVYIYSVTTGQVVQASLGYFINPLVTVLMGVLLLSERLRPLQWAAVGTGAAGVVALTVDYGRPPWLALILATSFATYGLLKNRVGRGVGAVASLSTETLLLAPFAMAALVWFEVSGRGTFTALGPGHALLLASTGVATAGPLLLFASAARRVPLSTIGLLQYVTPVMQFLLGVLLLGEQMPPSRWLGFATVWLALVLLTADAMRAARTRTALGAAQAPRPVTRGRL